ncbi:MAG: hypothetical protein FWB97_01535 [Oscillospiraceae bacterium]|nr:hypothetical protein [Oscillospiraceae bacterium]
MRKKLTQTMAFMLLIAMLALGGGVVTAAAGAGSDYVAANPMDLWDNLPVDG